MNLLVSNLGWRKSENSKILKFLNSKKILNLEYAPSKLFTFHDKKKDNKILNYYKKKNFSLTSAQSLLYGYENSFIFGNKIQRENFTTNLKRSLKRVKYFNTKSVVFGSPANKKSFNKSIKILDKMALNEFKKISLYCKKLNIVFCLEANPKIYDCDYLIKTRDVLKIVKKINSNYFKVNLDIGTILANKENLKFINKKNLKYIGHVQISVPYLESILSNKLYLNKIILIIGMSKKLKYKKNISLETLNLSTSELKKNINQILKIIYK